jgi:EAL domain-containing protein (putative c-di-GMP-specific phosphodiesterase class I)
LGLVKDMIINILKIDTSFVRDITKGQKELSMVKTIIEFARELGLKTVAGGVGTEKRL